MIRLKARLILAGLAGLGVLLGHGAAYVLATPHEHARSDVLHASGHGSFTPALALLMAVVIACVGEVVIKRARISSSENLFRRIGPVAARLATLQLATFMGLEIAERVIAGAGAAAVLDAPAVWLGMLAQLLIALGAAVVLVPLARFVRRIRRAAHLPRFGTLPSFPVSTLVFPRRLLAVGGVGLRGPPCP